MSLWSLHDDSRTWPDDTVATGTEDAIRALYFLAIGPEPGAIKIAEIDAYIEDPDGAQYVWNKYLQPPGWDEL